MKRILFGLVILATACAAYAGTQEFTMMSQGKTRKYRLHVPASYTGREAVPLVLVLHGLGGSGNQAFENLTGMSDESDAKGFIAVYPTALGSPTAWNSTWNFSTANTDDVKFLIALVAQIERNHKIDPKRVYSCGFSSGAIMSYQLAGAASDTFAAIAVAEGTIGVTQGSQVHEIPTPSSPVAVLAFHGRADDHIPYNGGPNRHDPSWNDMPVSKSIGFWVNYDGCQSTPTETTSDGGNVVRQRYANGHHGTDVVLYSIGDGTHEWPKATGLDPKEIIWTFFARHPKR